MSELVYVAHPIDLGDSPKLKESIAAAHEALASRNIATFDPGRPYECPWEAAEKVFAINEMALRESAGVLAIFPPGVPSVGTPMEVQTAVSRSCPVAALGANGSIQLRAMGVQRFGIDDVEDAADWLAKQLRHHPPGRRLKWLGPTECMPQRFHRGDAGFDLICADKVTVYPGAFVDVDCGIRVEMPRDVWAMVTGRSSTLRKRKLLVAQGIIDNGYRGPLFVGIWNLGEKRADIARGERLAQLIPFPLTSGTLRLEQVAELTETTRGDAGFGSTGGWASER